MEVYGNSKSGMILMVVAFSQYEFVFSKMRNGIINNAVITSRNMINIRISYQLKNQCLVKYVVQKQVSEICIFASELLVVLSNYDTDL